MSGKTPEETADAGTPAALNTIFVLSLFVIYSAISLSLLRG
jgi:hypothetical protein